MNIRFGCLLFLLLFISPARGQQAITVYSLNGDTLLDNNKYTNVQAAVNACPSSGCIVRVPTGTWPPAAPNAALVINQSNVNIQCSGMGVSFISYTGTTAIPAVIDLGTSTTGNPQYQNDTINWCTVSGNSNVQYAIRVRSVMRSDFSHNSLINVTAAGIQTNYGVRLNLYDLHTSSPEQAFTTQPQSCVILDGPDSNHKTTTTWVGQPVCEGVSGTGIVLNNTNNVTVYGGTSEQNNKGITLSNSAVSDTVVFLDTELNAVSNVEDNGYYNYFNGLTGNGLAHVLSSTQSSHWTGYSYDSITIDAGALNTQFDHVGYNNSGTGSLTDNATTTSKLRVVNLVGGVYQPDAFPGPNGITVNGSEVVTRPGGSSSTLQTKRVASCTTGSSAGSTCTTIVTWGTSFPDTNYTAVCSILASANVPYILNTSSKLAGSIVARIANLTAAAASGTIECTAVHD